MNTAELKIRLQRLWKETFNDSDKYISLVFDNYFNIDLCEYEEAGGEIVASLIGVPYYFGNLEKSIKALYLCGLATKMQYRSRGIMTRLLARINDKAREQGFAFTFLIPSDTGIRKFYHDRDYVNAFYRVVDNYTSVHDFDRDYESILAEQKEKVAELKRRHYRSLKALTFNSKAENADELRNGIRTLIRSIEDVQEDLQVIHSDKDIDIIIDENAVSGGKIHLTCNSSGAVTAVAFTSIADGAVVIHHLYSSDLASKYRVLQSIKTASPELGIRHFIPSIAMDRTALWFRTYGSFMHDASQVGEISITERVYSLAAHAKVYGMARILDLPEILKFQADSRRDLKYSILAKGPDGYTVERIDARDGKIHIKELPIDDKQVTSTHVMTKRDIGEILFRRRDTDNLITEAFGIPSINGAISLMLD